MKLKVQDGLPYVSVTLTYRANSLTLDRVILDTGSASSIFAADVVATIGLLPSLDDALDRIRGIGGSEVVFRKRLDSLEVGELVVEGFQVEIGAMRYGFEMDGIIGFDFLTRAKAIIDLANLELRPGQEV